MSMPFYVSPEQIIKDKADYARKGIARGRSVVVIQYANGIAFVAENPSRALHKISEIYDRIAFAAVGKYNEFESLRVAGVRLADTRGYSYDRKDVTGRGLANAYAQTLGTIFTENPKPFEVEIVVAEVGESAAEDQMYRLTFDGSVADEHGFVAMGGSAEAITAALSQSYTSGLAFPDALRVAVAAMNAGRSSADPLTIDGDVSDQDTSAQDSASPIPAGQLEVAVLDRTRNRRLFQRITGDRLEEVLNSQK
ncbi:MAG: proteasome subunit alpha [Actinomycetes bacterium]